MVADLASMPVIGKGVVGVDWHLLCVPNPCWGVETLVPLLHDAADADLPLQTTYISITNNTNMWVTMPVSAAQAVWKLITSINLDPAPGC